MSVYWNCWLYGAEVLGDEDYCVIEITVDPCVGSHTYYADVEDYLNQSGVV